MSFSALDQVGEGRGGSQGAMEGSEHGSWDVLEGFRVDHERGKRPWVESMWAWNKEA